MRSSYYAIDIAKLAMALLVVGIHAGLPFLNGEGFWAALEALPFKIAVPFFFIASGFFLGLKVKDNKVPKAEIIESWIKKNFRLYLVWTAVFLPFTIFGFSRDGLPFVKAVALFVRNVLFVGENYMSWPLWYLLALVVAGLIILSFEKIGISTKKQLLIAAGLYIVGCLLDRYSSVNPVSLYFSAFKTTKNGVFVGLLFMEIGYAVARTGVLKPLHILPFAFVSVLTRDFCGSATIFVSLLLFLLLMECGGAKNSKDNHIYLCFRHMSIVVYLVHMIFIAVIRLFINPTIGSWPLFLWATSCSLLTALLVISMPPGKVRKLLFCF